MYLVQIYTNVIDTVVIRVFILQPKRLFQRQNDCDSY
jgi:hypothetical protein